MTNYTPPLTSPAEPALKRWLDEAFVGLTQWLNFAPRDTVVFEILEQEPERPVVGMLAYFNNNVVAPQSGLYLYTDALSWSRVGGS